LDRLSADGARYGEPNAGNAGAAIPASAGRFEVKLPASGVLVFRRISSVSEWAEGIFKLLTMLASP